MMGQGKGHSHKMVVLPALSRPSTRIRASFSPKIDSRRETHSPIPAARRGDQAPTRPVGPSRSTRACSRRTRSSAPGLTVPAKLESVQVCIAQYDRVPVRKQLTAR